MIFLAPVLASAQPPVALPMIINWRHMYHHIKHTDVLDSFKRKGGH